ncbi:Phosphate acetyltransferase [Jeotgalicoccus saudimassiliensis]|uniref:Phosphate acetyltransferase n=1 Tax=Jeotgalicoccus saudimassiliensis TaxID=1461582 RepID=A0A078M1F4_9STAP|nr:phosphate acyltransferase [Jeotgalicoccus saudimassiliensis]CEA00099.1 Phosphate acetyltransferase [Jeotgalicoccus saudimassiliensis]
MNFDETLKINSSTRASIALVKAASEDLLELVTETAGELGIIWHLFDDEQTLKEMFSELNHDYKLHNITIHHSTDDTGAAQQAGRFIADGGADVLMKGLISTGVILKAVLNKELKLLDQELLSHVALFSMPNYHKPVIISDAAMNIDPDTETKIKIIENAVTASHRLGIEKPKVALLSAVEKLNEKIASTVTNDTIVSGHKFDNAIIDGPMQYDLAMSKSAAAIKGYTSEVAGDADILIMPHIDAGNILYKALVTTAGGHVAGMITGLKVPFVLTSRADSKEEKYNSIKLAIKMMEHNQEDV